jgi:hypothetical protein
MNTPSVRFRNEVQVNEAPKSVAKSATTPSTASKPSRKEQIEMLSSNLKLFVFSQEICICTPDT